jgi:hypothetical protein
MPNYFFLRQLKLCIFSQNVKKNAHKTRIISYNKNPINIKSKTWKRWQLKNTTTILRFIAWWRQSTQSYVQYVYYKFVWFLYIFVPVISYLWEKWQNVKWRNYVQVNVIDKGMLCSRSRQWFLLLTYMTIDVSPSWRLLCYGCDKRDH